MPLCICKYLSVCAVHDTCRLARHAQSFLLKWFLKDVVTREAKRQVMVMVCRPHHQHIKQIELTDKIKYLETSARCFCPLCPILPRCLGCIRKLKHKKSPKVFPTLQQMTAYEFWWQLSAHWLNNRDAFDSRFVFQSRGGTCQQDNMELLSLLEKVNRSCPPAGLGSARLKLLIIVLHEWSENFRHGF